MAQSSALIGKSLWPAQLHLCVACDMATSFPPLPSTLKMNHAMGEPFYFRDEGEVMASWGEARLIKYLDGKLVLKGGSKEDRIAAREWISKFLNNAVLREG